MVQTKNAGYVRLLFARFQRNTLSSKITFNRRRSCFVLENPMRSLILSVSSERWLTPIRNAVLAHAGYGVIPSLSAAAALDVLSNRRVSAMVIGQSISASDRLRLCSEGRRQGIPAVVLDRSLESSHPLQEIHIDPADGPEAFLNAVAAVLSGQDKWNR
jgi:hypothetical protein